MPHWRTLIEKDHLGAWDLVEKGTTKPKDYTLTIKDVQSNVLKTVQTPKGKRKCVITFAEARKKFVANSTNCQTIESLYGPDTDGWIGRTITLYQSETRDPNSRSGAKVKCIRVRPKRPTGPVEHVPEVPVDEQLREEQNEAFGREPGEEG